MTPNQTPGDGRYEHYFKTLIFIQIECNVTLVFFTYILWVNRLPFNLLDLIMLIDFWYNIVLLVSACMLFSVFSQASLQYDSYNDGSYYHMCGGTIIDSFYIMTAAHCILRFALIHPINAPPVLLIQCLLVSKHSVSLIFFNQHGC